MARSSRILAGSSRRRAAVGKSLRLALTKLTANCLNADLSWGLRVHGDLEGEVALTTDPYQLIWTAPFWHSRVDAGTFADRIFVLLLQAREPTRRICRWPLVR